MNGGSVAICAKDPSSILIRCTTCECSLEFEVVAKCKHEPIYTESPPLSRSLPTTLSSHHDARIRNVTPHHE